MSARSGAPEPTRDYSNRSPLSLAVLGAGLVGAVLLMAADLSTLVEIKAGDVTKETLTGHGQHAWAVFVLGLGALVLTYAVASGRSRPALGGLLVIGLTVVLIALIKDLSDLSATGVYGPNYQSAYAAKGPAFYLETAGAVLLLAAGGFGLALGMGPPSVTPTSSPEARSDPAP